MGIVRQNQIPRILRRHTTQTQDLVNAEVVGSHGQNHVLVKLDVSCPSGGLEAIIPNSSSSTYPPGASVLVGKAGGGRARAVLSKPPSGGGTAAPLTSDTTVKVIRKPLVTAQYYAIIPDPGDSSTALVHGYGLDGSYQGQIAAVTFATMLATDDTIIASTPIKGVPGVPDGFATIGETGGADLVLAVVDLDAQTVTEVTLPDATEGIFTGTLFVDPAGPYLYAGGVVDDAATENKLYRALLPDLSPLIEVGALTDPGPTSSHIGPGIVLPTRWRVPVQSENNWSTIDHVELDPDAVPQTGSEPDEVHGESVSPIFPLGHDDVGTGWFAFSDGGVFIRKIGNTGDGELAGFTDGDYQDDGVQVLFSGPEDDRWWTFYGVFQAPQSGGPPRVARVQFEGVGILSLPTPVELDITAAAADTGFSLSQVTPVALLPWFD